MTEQPKTAKTDRSKTLVLVIALIAFLPLFIAYVVFLYFPMLVPGARTNQGTLIQPPVRVNDDNLALPGKWVMLIPVKAECDNACERVLYLSRQVRIGLGKDASRIRRVILTSDSLSTDFLDLLEREHDQVTIIGLGRDAAAILRNVVTDPLGDPVVFLMDPIGNIMMYYLSSQGGKPMLDDLKRLLKVSTIG